MPGRALSAADVAAARAAVTRAAALAVAYGAAAQRHPARRALFETLRDHHEVAVTTVAAQVPAAAPTTAPSATATGPTGRPTTAAPTQASGEVPADLLPAGTDDSPAALHATIETLYGAEGAAATTARGDALEVSGLLAPLFASLFAAGNAQSELLDRDGDPALATATTTPTASPAATASATSAASAANPTAARVAAPPPQAAILRALTTMLAASHGAIYATATAGGALAPQAATAAGALARQRAREGWLAHLRLRDQLIAQIEARGGAPVPALAAYRLPTTPVDVPTALRLLSQVEDVCAATAHDATAQVGTDLRALTVDALAGMALRAQRARLAAGASPATASRALPGAT